MASLRRSKVLSPDGQTAKFLYTIIKQLDLKAINWNEVASGLDITNGHAARMRYSRFKAQIEGLPTQSKPRAPRPKKDASVAAKGKGKNKPGYEPGKADDLIGEDDDCDGDVKMEQNCGLGIKKEGVSKIKYEDAMADVRMDPTAALDTVRVKPEPGLMTKSSITEKSTVHNSKVKQEPTISPSPPSYSLSPTSGLAALDLTPYCTPPLTPTVNTLGFSSTPMNTYPHYPTPPTLPPHATVSLADLQLPPIPRPTHQMPLPTFSYPLSPSPMDFDFDFNAPITMPPWQPQFDLFRPINVGVKRERME
jgi:hypothetical protein